MTQNSFYVSLGRPGQILAPMVDASELPFRMLCRKYGADLCYAPMIHARCFLERSQYREEVFDTCPEDRPLIAQFCGNDPEVVLQAALLVQDHCDAIDLNLGCPQKIARKGHYGAFLLEEMDLVESIVKTLVAGLSIPVTCKIRILPCKRQTIEIAQRLERAGCQLLAVHGRTKEMLRDKIRETDYDIIRDIKRAVNIPVVANGSVENYAEMLRCLEVTEADAVMSAEGLLNNPMLFSGESPSPGDVRKVLLTLEYVDLVDRFPTSMGTVRGHIAKILYQELAVHPDLRIKVMNSRGTSDLRLYLKQLENRLRAETAEDKQQYAALKSWYRRFHYRASEDRTGIDSADPGVFEGIGEMFSSE